MVWMASNSSTASLALLDCSGPMRCSSTPGNCALQRRPFALGLLHAVLAEDADGRRRSTGTISGRLEGLGDGDQLHVARHRARPRARPWRCCASISAEPPCGVVRRLSLSRAMPMPP